MRYTIIDNKKRIGFLTMAMGALLSSSCTPHSSPEQTNLSSLAQAKTYSVSGAELPNQPANSIVLYDFEEPSNNFDFLDGFRGHTLTENAPHIIYGNSLLLRPGTSSGPVVVATKMTQYNQDRLRALGQFSQISFVIRSHSPLTDFRFELQLVDQTGKVWAHQKPVSFGDGTAERYIALLEPSEFAPLNRPKSASQLGFSQIQQLRISVVKERGINGVPSDPTFLIDTIKLSSDSAYPIVAKTVAGGVNHAWKRESFPTPFQGPPAIIASPQSFLGEDPIGVRFRAATNAGIMIRLEEEDSTRDGTSHFYEELGYFAFPTGWIRNAEGQIIGEAGRTTAQNAGRGVDQWHRQPYMQTYKNPVVFMNIASYAGFHPCHARLRKVQNDAFEFMIEEWDYLDGQHFTETLSYVVLESGTHEISDKMLIEVGKQQGATTSRSSPSWSTVNFPRGFLDAPVVTAQVQTFGGFNAVVTRLDGVDENSFRWRMQEEKANDDIHFRETIGFLAMGSAFVAPPTDPLACDERFIIDPESQVFKGNLLYEGSDHRTACNDERQHRGAAYAFQLKTHGARFSAKLSGAATLLTLRTSDCSKGQELFCQEAESGQALEISEDLPPGKYYIFVDAGPGQGGEYELSVEFETLEDYTNLSCDAPMLMGARDYTIEGAWPEVGASGEMTGSCGGAGPEQVYAFRTPPRYDPDDQYDRIHFKATSSDPNVVLYLRRSPILGERMCSDPDVELACSAADTNGQSNIELYLPSEGIYYLIVDSKASQGGRYSVDIDYNFKRTLPANSSGSCRYAQKIEPKTQLLAGHINVKGPDRAYGGRQCGTQPSYPGDSGRPEKSFTFEVTKETYFEAENRGAARNFDAALYLRNAHCDQLVCAEEWSEYDHAKIGRLLSPGIYHLFVDYADVDAGRVNRYEVQLKFGDDVAGECKAAKELNPVSQVISGKLNPSKWSTIEPASNRVDPCFGDLSEHVYSFDVTTSKLLRARVDYGDGIALYLREGDCRSGEAELACNHQVFATDSALIEQRLAPGRYFLFVDQYDRPGHDSEPRPRDFGTYSVGLEFR